MEERKQKDQGAPTAQSKAIRQAETALRSAALEYAEANMAYRAAFDRHHEVRRYLGLPPGQQPAPLHPETLAACNVSNEKMDALAKAAHSLRKARAKVAVSS